FRSLRLRVSARVFLPILSHASRSWLLPHLADRIRGMSLTLAHGFARAARRIFLCLALHFRVDLRAEHERVAGEIKPQQQHDDTPEGAIGFAIGRGAARVDRE